MKSVMKQSGARHRLFHHRTLLTGLLLTLPGFFPVAADVLLFTVTAIVAEPTCNLASSQDIAMGDIDGPTLAKDGRTAPTLFSIQLTNCTSTSAKLTFTSTTAEQQRGNFYPIEGDDLGFLLAFTDENGNHIKLGNEINRSLESTNNTLRFGVQAIRDANNTLVPGQFSAVATVTIDYL